MFQWLSSYPAPWHFVSESATDKRSQDRGDAIGCSSKAQKLWTFLRGCSEPDNRENSHANSGSAEASDGPADYKSCRVLSHGADEASHFENEYGNKKPKLDRKVLEKLSPGWLEGYNN